MSVSEPQRTCLGCRKTVNADFLCRLQVQLGDEGAIVALVVSSTSVGGRGAWICRAEPTVVSESVLLPVRVLGACATLAKQKKAFGRGFRKEVPPHVVERFFADYREE
jgi:predicted RNA-binding protein YlxR (DUF448 family)